MGPKESRALDRKAREFFEHRLESLAEKPKLVQIGTDYVRIGNSASSDVLSCSSRKAARKASGRSGDDSYLSCMCVAHFALLYE